MSGGSLIGQTILPRNKSAFNEPATTLNLHYPTPNDVGFVNGRLSAQSDPSNSQSGSIHQPYGPDPHFGTSPFQPIIGIDVGYGGEAYGGEVYPQGYIPFPPGHIYSQHATGTRHAKSQFENDPSPDFYNDYASG
jgi:hypothetical protein